MKVYIKIKNIIKTMILLLLIIILSLWLPIKLAIKKDMVDNQEYFICEKVSTTGFEWIVVDGNYNYTGYIELKGKIPLEEYRNYYPSIRFNKFVCLGQIVGEDIFDGYKYLIFNVDRWEVLYPVQRDSLIPEFLLPKYGFTFWDTIQ